MVDLKELITVQNVRGYIDEQGTAQLNVEDVARGLGFVDYQEKDSATSGRKTYEVVRWERVNKYLHDFGFIPTSGDDFKASDFVPENMFYRLAMKAKNETAEAFQAKVADEILPTIRRTGSYSVKSALTTTEILADVEKATAKLQSMFGVKRGIAFAHVIDISQELYKLKLEPLKQLLPPVEHETGFLNPTQIGEKLGGLKPRMVNMLLAEAGLQYKDNKNWRLTEIGKDFGEEMPYTRNSHSGYQIRWSDRVLSVINAKV